MAKIHYKRNFAVDGEATMQLVTDFLRTFYTGKLM